MIVDRRATVLERLGSGVGQYRYTEAVILDGDPLYAIGEFHTLGPATMRTRSANSPARCCASGRNTHIRCANAGR